MTQLGDGIIKMEKMLKNNEFGNQYILTVVDEFTKITTLYACKSVTAMEYIEVLMKHVSLFGLMERIRSDGGSQFTANICREVAKYLGILHFVILPYHKQMALWREETGR